jgi:hypothetical protein
MLIALSLVHAATTIQQRSVEEDQRALIALENEWLASERDAAVLDESSLRISCIRFSVATS